MKRKANTLYSDQRGMVSIIVTMILIIVMTLVVLAMAQDSNREQRQVLDRQLSEQAFYNAESGINDWSNYIYEKSLAETTGGDALPLTKTECDPEDSDYPGSPDPRIDGEDGVNTYSCVLYDRAPDDILINGLKPHEAVVIPIEPTGDNMIKHLAFEWKPSGVDSILGGCDLSSTSVLPAALPDNCNTGALRIDIIDPSGTREQIAARNFSAYMLPGRSNVNPNSITYEQTNNDASKANIVAAKCGAENSKYCLAEIRFPGQGINVGEKYYLRVSSFYKAVDFRLYGCNASTNANSCEYDKVNGSQRTSFLNAQIELDVTGKANDVLRRLQVRIPAEADAFDIAGDAIRSSQAVRKCSVVSAVSNTATDPTGNCSP